MLRFVTLLTLFVLALTAPALAADECNSLVFDTTGKVNTLEVEGPLRDLARDGADPALVRVITTAEMNRYGNFDKYAGALLSKCSSWQSAGGRLKNNIFLLLLEPSGKVAVQFAKRGPFQNVLTHEKILDISQEMGGLISKGDLTGAAKAGLLRAHSILSAPKAEAVIRVPVGPAAPVTIVNHNEKPADLSGFFSFLKWVLLISVIGTGIGLAIRWRIAKTKATAKCLAAQQKAQTIRGECTALVGDFDTQLMTLNALLTGTQSILKPIDFEGFQSKIEGLKSRMESAKRQYVSTSSGSTNDPENSGLSKEAYDAMTQVFNRTRSELAEISNDATKLEWSIRYVKKLQASAQPAIDRLALEIRETTTWINEENSVKTEGPRASLKKAIDLLELAEDKLAEKAYQAVSNACTEGGSQIKKATQELKDLVAKRQEVENSLSKIEALDLSDVLERADAIISSTRQTYGADSVASAPKHRANIAQKLIERRVAISSAKSASTTQNLDQARKQIETAKKATADINFELRAIEDMGPAVIRKRQAKEQASYRSSYLPSSGHYHTHPRENDGPGFGTGLAVGVLGTMAVESAMEERKERSDWGTRSNDDDNGFGGCSVQTSSNDDADHGFGGETVSTSNDNDTGFTDNN